jgi:acetyl-CoA carboxylase biotin carboxyl carrier protein
MTDPADPNSSSRPSGPEFPDLRYLRELAKMFRQYELDELELESGDQRILLRRSDMPAGGAVALAPAPQVTQMAAPAAAAPRAADAPAAAASESGDFITSPFVGTFYRSARPDAPAFAEVGKKVAAGETVCIIEAMKLFNEIEADYACVIEEVLVDNASPLEYGTKLFRVRKL